VKKILNILDPVLNILSSQKFPEQAIEYVTYMENDLFEAYSTGVYSTACPRPIGLK